MNMQWEQDGGSQQSFGLWQKTPNVFGPSLPPPKPKQLAPQTVEQSQTSVHNKFGALETVDEGDIDADTDEEEMPEVISDPAYLLYGCGFVSRDASVRLPQPDMTMPIKPKNVSKQSSKKK